MTAFKLNPYIYCVDHRSSKPVVVGSNPTSRAILNYSAGDYNRRKCLEELGVTVPNLPGWKLSVEHG